MELIERDALAGDSARAHHLYDRGRIAVMVSFVGDNPSKDFVYVVDCSIARLFHCLLT